ncbi:zinc-ribbon domain-containing protein [Aquabacterium sp.]|uniref:zinc ribbon domain-containing protein n=1 Tax=Aquabacterium sp. TaxID=1872578 RepID=UPI0035AE57B4
MGRFCTRCGTANGDDDAFCQNCGAPLNKAALTETASAPPVATEPTPVMPAAWPARRLAIWGGLTLSALVAAGGAIYVIGKPPEASPANLLVAAKGDLAALVKAKAPASLCLHNMDYAADTFNVAEYDQRTLGWLDMLSSAGLYEKVGPIASGNGFFSQTLVQYKPTSVLMKWRDGNRLCIAHSAVVSEVTDIGTPQDVRVRPDAPGQHMVHAKVVVAAADPADWLSKPGVAEHMLPLLPDWTWAPSEGHLTAAREEDFVVKEGKWRIATGISAAEVRNSRATQREQDEAKASAEPGFWSRIKSMLGMQTHPLEGTWQVDTETTPSVFGMRFSQAGIEEQLTFTSDAIVIKGREIKCRFVQEGQRIKVYPEGEKSVLVFEMPDENTAQLNLGLITIPYKRVN